MKFRLDVYGHIYSGARATYSYTVDTGIALALADRTRKYRDEDAAKCASDFASLIDWRLVECRTDVRRSAGELERCYREKTLRGFNNSRSARYFA